MKKLFFAALLAVVFIIGSSASALAETEAGKTTVVILLDRGDPTTMTEKQFEMREKVGEWMENDLANIFKRKKFESVIINKREEFTPGPDKYLISIAIKSYNPGNKAARAFVGYGAGAASLDIRYELFGEGDSALLSTDDGVGSSRDWRNIARKLNENIYDQVREKIQP